MADGNLIRTPVRDSLGFDQRRLAGFRRKHGMHLHWCNRQFRAQYGWRGLKPIPFDTTNSFCRDALSTLHERPVDLGMQIQDGYICNGTLVLAAIPLALKAQKDAIRLDLSQGGRERAEAGAPMDEAVEHWKYGEKTQAKAEYSRTTITGDPLPHGAILPPKTAPTSSRVFFPKLRARR